MWFSPVFAQRAYAEFTLRKRDVHALADPLICHFLPVEVNGKKVAKTSVAEVLFTSILTLHYIFE